MFNHKKILSLALAGAMVASLAIPSFAADETESATNRATKVTGNYQAVDIAVVVPTTGKVIINPYALPVEILAKDTTNNTAAVKVEKQQIVTVPMAIKNQSGTKLNINISYTASVTGAFTFATAPIEDITKDTKNDGFVYIDVQSAPSSVKGATSAVTAAAIAAAWKDMTPTEYSADTDNVLAVKATTTAVSKAGMGTLAAATLDNDGAFSEYAEGSIAFVALTGQVAQNPKTAWVAKDGMTVNLAYTFTPNTDA
jgi:hypothetical protein